MALKGNLRDFSITQLLNLINLAKKTGSLIIEGPDAKSTISFRDGRLSFAVMESEDNSLGAVLYQTGIITDSQYSTLRKRAANMTDKELGLLLINAGYVSQQQVINSLQTYYVEVVRSLFSWVEGFFNFDANTKVPQDKIPVRMDLQNLIMEGSRQMRELELLQDEIPDLDIALKFTDGSGVNLKNVNLSVEEWRVASYIAPKNSIRQIASATKMSDLEIRRIVYGMLQAGLVELTRQKGIPRTLPDLSASVPGKDRIEQKNLVNRIIGRIRSL
ncbi:MAG: DUF4388 domain-containing protein [Anaerolineales bacterium]|nr:DUF4388 domain-containing protein [Anaerolineales bacterium]